MTTAYGNRTNFNPRSREGSDEHRSSEDQNADISIRAPARGATTFSGIFQNLANNFNPRSREGSDAGSKRRLLHKAISIRAPARGATTTVNISCTFTQFQSALPRGERPFRNSSALVKFDYFNPRSREGSDDNIVNSVFPMPYFNPRSREGSDQMDRIMGYSMDISIRAPARGATGEHYYRVSRYGISIRAPARGATLQDCFEALMRIFQSALPRGERPSVAQRLSVSRHNFNPRSREGSDTPW